MRKAFKRGIVAIIIAAILTGFIPQKVEAAPLPAININEELIQKAIAVLCALMATNSTMTLTKSVTNIVEENEKTQEQQEEQVAEAESETQRVIEMKQSYAPTTSTPNGVIRRIDPETQEIVQVRFFDEDGDAALDIDLTNHGNSKLHPWPYHKHKFINKHRQKAEPLSENEIRHYIDDWSTHLMNN